MRTKLLFVLAGALCVGVVLGAGTTNQSGNMAYSLFPDPVVATGKGFTIRNSEVDAAVTSLKATLAAQGQTLPDGQDTALEARLLNRLILTRIMQEKATAADRAAAHAKADKFIAATKKQAPSEASYRRQLLAVGLDPAVFEKRAYEQALVETIVNREIRDKLSVTAAQVRAFYAQGTDFMTRDLEAKLQKLAQAGQTNSSAYTNDQARIDQIKKANQASLQAPAMVRGDMIVVYTRDQLTGDELSSSAKAAKKAKLVKALARLKAGEAFSKVADDVSEDSAVAQNHGEYTTPLDQVPLPSLREALTTLPVGQLSGIITTRVGYYVVKVSRRTPAHKISLDQAKPEIRDRLLTELVNKHFPAYYAKLKKDYNVKINMSAISTD